MPNALCCAHFIYEVGCDWGRKEGGRDIERRHKERHRERGTDRNTEVQRGRKTHIQRGRNVEKRDSIENGRAQRDR